jgi:hypothetical protein
LFLNDFVFVHRLAMPLADDLNDLNVLNSPF